MINRRSGQFGVTCGGEIRPKNYYGDEMKTSLRERESGGPDCYFLLRPGKEGDKML